MAGARFTDPQTSHDAAASVKDITRTQKAVLKLLAAVGPLTDEDLIGYYTWQTLVADPYDFPKASESGIRSRRAELVTLGLVKDSGERAKLASGRHAIVWQVV